jgi:ribosomal protein S18 acetylase RimI-like enzyme
MRLRPPSPRDAEAVLAVLVARDLADIGRPDISLDDVTADWDMPGIEPALDCFVAEDDGGDVVGYAVVDRRGASLAVHPRAEGHGVGTALREAVERRMAERGQPLLQAITASNVAAVEHLRAAGYERRHVYQRMRAPLDAVPEPPAGAAVRRIDLDAEAVAVHALVEGALDEIGGNVPEPFDPWMKWAAGHSEPEFRLAVDDDGGLAGAALGEQWERGTGYVAQIGVAPGARGRGHGRTLLLALAAAFRAAGLQTIELSVHGANAPATGLYESAGMAPDFRAERWERPS